jgi:hypothetical protein
MLSRQGELTKRQLEHVAGKRTLAKLLAKGWIEITAPDTFRSTAAGVAAMKTKIPLGS